MNVCQVSSNEAAYETAKSTSGANASQGDNGFKDILKNKSSKVNSDKGKANQSQKGGEEKIKDDDSLASEGNTDLDKTVGYEIPIEIVSNFFSQVGLFSDKANASTETDSAQTGIMPLSITGDESSSQVSQMQQKVLLYTLNTLGIRSGVHSLEGELAPAENLQVKDSESKALNNTQGTLKTLDIKNDSLVLAVDEKSAMLNEKSTMLNEKGSQKSSDKSGFYSEGKLSGEASTSIKDELKEDSNGLNTLVFKPKDNMVNIKVAEPTVTKAWETAAEDIGKAVVESIKDNKIEKLNISLNPKELGEIKVEFVIDNDKISVSLVCSNEKTKRLLSENTDTLSKIVQSNLKQETTVNVSYSEKSSHQESSSENFDGKGNSGGYKDGSHQNNRREEDSNQDFLQKLRLEFVDNEKVEV